tara:strand:- start:681 stop:1676 length:996 start_codon:yes stop_codon:yes gene_type:complete
MRVLHHGKFGNRALSIFEKNILVTGATGLLGSHFSDYLLKNNCEFTALAIEDSYSSNFENSFSQVEVNYVDIANFKELNSFLNSNDFDIIYHFAAQTQVGDAINNPIRTFKSNIEGTWNILEICRHSNLPIVIASSDKAYGISDRLPYKENFELKGEFPYEVSKSVTDLLANTYRKTYDQNLVTLRCGNIYGGGDLNWERLIPGVIKWLLEGEVPVLRSDGSYIRDWVYVDDVVMAYIEVGNKLYERKVRNTSYNFSSSDNFSVDYVYRKICELIKGEYIEPAYNISSDKEIPSQYLDSSLIREDLDVVAKVNLDEGLEKTITWYKEFLKL